jgi:hypothetical protein
MNKNFKYITTLFQRFNTALPSSAAVERVFSIAKGVLKDYRKIRKYYEIPGNTGPKT